jgi:Tfp pilus assembly protein PilF
MARRMKWLAAAACIASTAIAATNVRQEASLEAGRRAYEASDYGKAILELQGVAAKEPQNGDVQLLLAKSYLEMQERDPAVKSAERAVEIDPRNSIYHEWLGRAYGEKADHTGWFSAISLAKKTRKEFETAVQLDGRNFAARQALI